MHPFFIRDNHTKVLHSLVKVLITNVETFTDNIITNTQFLNSKMMSVIAVALHFQMR
jgi:hypothetical protein